jgi:hypothetical protein
MGRKKETDECTTNLEPGVSRLRSGLHVDGLYNFLGLIQICLPELYYKTPVPISYKPESSPYCKPSHCKQLSAGFWNIYNLHN